MIFSTSFRMKRIRALFLLLGGLIVLSSPQWLIAQTIQFSIHVSSNLNATVDQEMSFGELIAGSGTNDINLGDPGMGIFAITGNEEMDIIVTMTPPANLTHTGISTDVIPFTLNYAYANKGANDVNQAVVASGNSARFQMLGRTSGPAGAPPTPPSSDHTPQETTAYLYVYGSLTVGSIDAGTYSGMVTIDVAYD